MSSWLIPLIGISLAAWTLLGKQGLLQNERRTNSKICDTEACSAVATLMINTMNESIDPCIDFYEYACSNWLSSNPLPDKRRRTYWDQFGPFHRPIMARLRDLLETEPSPEDIFAIQHMKKLYKKCMDDETRESEGVEPMMTVFQETNGWPMIMDSDNWNKNTMPWQNIITYYGNLTGYFTFFQLRHEYFEGYQSALYIFPMEYSGNNLASENMILYRSVIKSLAQLFIEKNNVRVPEERLDKDIDDLIKFEEALAKITEGFSDLECEFVAENLEPDILEHVTSSGSPVGKIDLWEFLRQLENDTAIFLCGKDIFMKIMKHWESTDERTIVNFIQWHFLLHMSPHLTTEVTDILSPLFSITKEARFLEPHWLKCIQINDPATIHLFGREFYENATKTAIDKVTKNIRKLFEFQTFNSDWLSVESKNAVKEKFISIENRVEYPKWYSYEMQLISYYENFEIGESYLQSIFRLMNTHWSQGIQFFGDVEAYDGEIDFRMLPIAVHTSYHPKLLGFPKLDYQPYLFPEMLPEYVEYGTMGRIIGHELADRSDDHVLRYRFNPNELLFTRNMKKTFFERAKCFIGEFDEPLTNEKIKKMRVNIAHWHGVQGAFDAYKEIKDEKYPSGELKLPKFDGFTDEKMFFISYAQSWCKASNDNDEVDTSSSRLQVINALSNTLAFAEAFKCPKNSPMNPEKKCNLWKSVAP